MPQQQSLQDALYCEVKIRQQPISKHLMTAGRKNSSLTGRNLLRKKKE